MRFASLPLTAVFLAAAVETGAPWWVAALAWIAPDLGLLTAAADRWRLYNALHALPGPVALAATAAAGLVPWLLPLAWASHIAVDRALGYGLRTPDGLQRG